MNFYSHLNNFGELSADEFVEATAISFEIHGSAVAKLAEKRFFLFIDGRTLHWDAGMHDEAYDNYIFCIFERHYF